MQRFWKRFGIPFLIVAVISGAGAWLARQDKAKQVPTRETVAPAPAPATGPPPLPTGAVIRSLDKLNASAKAVGCPTLEMGDPAVRIFDTAECLGVKAESNEALMLSAGRWNIDFYAWAAKQGCDPTVVHSAALIHDSVIQCLEGRLLPAGQTPRKDRAK